MIDIVRRLVEFECIDDVESMGLICVFCGAGAFRGFNA